MMDRMPDIIALPDGGEAWSHEFDAFRVKVLVPPTTSLAGTVNFGFRAPYLIVFEENALTLTQAHDDAVQRGLYAWAADGATSVVYVSPTDAGGWDAADETLFIDLVAESRINQYYRSGVAMERDRFTKAWKGCYIRGAVFRTYLFGSGRSADYLARHCLKTLDGQYLWGPGEITPAACVLERLSTQPEPQRRDIPIVSVGNSDAVNACLAARCDSLLVANAANADSCRRFLTPFKRWCGKLELEPDMDVEGMAEEPGFVTVPTSADNRGDDAGTREHRVGYIAYWRRDLAEAGKLPLVLAFHGGGDSAYHIAIVSGWWRVAQRHGFLLVCVEDHLNTSATEVLALIAQLKARYPIDDRRVYASGFSMGGCKCWDLYQEYPQAFAALAPMCATFEVGTNQYGEPSPKPINRAHTVPLFYAGGERSPLAELPFQSPKCRDRIAYVFAVNRVRKPYAADYDDRLGWEDPIWGVAGDAVERIEDPSRGSVLTIHRFESADGVCRTALASVDNQEHECREHTCEHAWRFMRQFALD